MEKKKYYISSDLEYTLSTIFNKSKNIDNIILDGIRKEVIHTLNQAFNNEINIEYINYNKIKNSMLILGKK